MTRKLVASIALVAITLSIFASYADAQKLIEEDYWRLKIQPQPGRAWGLDKMKVNGQLYYFFAYELENPEKRAIQVDLQIYMITDRMVDGTDPKMVRPWNSFRGWQLPKQPIDEREVFDNTPKYHLQKRFYDRPNSGAAGAIKALLAGKFGPVTHSSKIGNLAAGAKIKGVAIFGKVDPNMDYCGIVVKGLVNRVKNIQDEMFLEDRVRIYRYHSPGSASTAAENPIIARRPAVMKIIKRQQIEYPMD